MDAALQCVDPFGLSVLSSVYEGLDRLYLLDDET